MTLNEFLSLCSDEEARIELKIEFSDYEEYIYSHFWLSDYFTSDDTVKYYKEYQVISFGFLTKQNADIQITIKP